MKKKIKSKQNIAKKVEMPGITKVASLSTAQLGYQLNIEYSEMMRIQANIREINIELRKRQEAKD